MAADSSYLFPSLHSKEVGRLFGRVDGVARKLDIANLISHQVLRLAIELKSKALPSSVHEAVSRSLCHSRQTAAKYYQSGGH